MQAAAGRNVKLGVGKGVVSTLPSPISRLVVSLSHLQAGSLSYRHGLLHPPHREIEGTHQRGGIAQSHV